MNINAWSGIEDHRVNAVYDIPNDANVVKYVPRSGAGYELGINVDGTDGTAALDLSGGQWDVAFKQPVEAARFKPANLNRLVNVEPIKLDDETTIRTFAISKTMDGPQHVILSELDVVRNDEHYYISWSWPPHVK